MEWKSEALTIAGANGTQFRRGFWSTAQLRLSEIKEKSPVAALTNDTLCHSRSVLNESDLCGGRRGHGETGREKT